MTDPRRARYQALFASESRSLLAGARRALDAWRDDPDGGDAPEVIFRALHTVKGMAASLDFAAVVDLTHGTESTLSEVRGDGRYPTAGWLGELEQRLDQVAAACDAALDSGDSSTVRHDDATSPRGPRIARVDLDRLDALLSDLGALVTARQELERRAAADRFSPIARTALQMAHRLDVLQDRILDVRLAPLAEVFERIPPIVRDLARQLDKEVTVDVSGDTLEVDRAILDQLSEPLLHLLRNAVDHGIERRDQRRAGGKRPAGRIAVTARRDGGAVIVEVTDDGRGIDHEAVARRARALGILDDNAELSDDGLLAILERPGFSTAGAVTSVSGRGVGLDVVVARLREVGAALSLTTVPGRGSIFTVRLPTRLGIVRSLVTGVASERYVMPLTQVVELVAADTESIRRGDGRMTLDVRGESLPVVDLRRLLQYRCAPPAARRPAVVFEANARRVALLTDAVHGQMDVVVQ
ncbi:MAG: chemotaxis protein CheA, partial [Gemmatimonadales bacterium]